MIYDKFWMKDAGESFEPTIGPSETPQVGDDNYWESIFPSWNTFDPTTGPQD